MELYTLDDSFRPVDLIENYSSCIWTERFNEVGEVSIEIPYYDGVRNKIGIGSWLSLNKSNRFMRIDTTDISLNDDGQLIYTASGLESIDILRFRNAWNTLGGVGDNPNYSYTLSPYVALVRQGRRGFVGDMTGDWAPSSNRDVIPNSYWVSSPTSPGQLPLPLDNVLFSMDRPITVLEHVTDIAKKYSLGFRLYLEKYNGNLYWQVYPGRDRSLTQNVLPPVVFSPKLDNITNMSMLESIRNFKTSQGVYTNTNFRYVDRMGFESQRGFEKRSAWLMEQQPDGVGTVERNAWMDSLSVQELNLTTRIMALDGDVSRTNQYVYQEDYELGDLVDIVSDWGFTGRCRVTEQVFSNDREGEKAFPTFELEDTYTPDSWMAVPTSENWSNTANTWSER